MKHTSNNVTQYKHTHKDNDILDKGMLLMYRFERTKKKEKNRKNKIPILQFSIQLACAITTNSKTILNHQTFMNL